MKHLKMHQASLVDSAVKIPGFRDLKALLLYAAILDPSSSFCRITRRIFGKCNGAVIVAKAALGNAPEIPPVSISQ
jgi:hypothetical protein